MRQIAHAQRHLTGTAPLPKLRLFCGRGGSGDIWNPAVLAGKDLNNLSLSFSVAGGSEDETKVGEGDPHHFGNQYLHIFLAACLTPSHPFSTGVWGDGIEMPWRGSSKGKYAFRFCRGFGLEIGALHDPFDLNAKVLYLDRFDAEGLGQWYNKDARTPHIAHVDLKANNVPYDFLCSNVFDFVASSHVLEHFPNPGLALEEWLRVTAPGGIVYLIIPNRDKTFDRHRAVTPVDQLIAAFHSRDHVAPLAQYVDYFENREIKSGQPRLSVDEIKEQFERQESIHVYTYTPETARNFFIAICKELDAELTFFAAEGIDIHAVIKKRGERRKKPRKYSVLNRTKMTMRKHLPGPVLNFMRRLKSRASIQ